MFFVIELNKQKKKQTNLHSRKRDFFLASSRSLALAHTARLFACTRVALTVVVVGIVVVVILICFLLVAVVVVIVAVVVAVTDEIVLISSQT